MSGRKVNVGMVGAGFIGQLAHLANLIELKNCRVAALAEMRPELRRRAAARYEIPRTYATHTELLKDPEVEAVVVVTPRPFTAPVAMDCLQAGKHVLTEKPIAGTLEIAQKLADAARSKRVHYAIGYMRRYDEGVQKAKALLDQFAVSQELGPVLFVRAHCWVGNTYCNADGHVVTDEKADYSEKGWAMSPDWVPGDRRAEYEVYSNTYVHTVNMLRYLFGKTPSAEYVNFGLPTGQIAVFDFGGFRATLESGRSSGRDWDEVVEVYFAHGKMTLKIPPALLRNVPASVELYKMGTTQEIVSPQLGSTWSFRRQSQAFVDDILNGRESLTAGVDALEDLRLLDALWKLEFRRTGAPVA